jgi:translation initiation factor IF-3
VQTFNNQSGGQKPPFQRPNNFQNNSGGGNRFNRDNNQKQHNPNGPRANNYINSDPIRLIDQNGEMIGVVPLRQAKNMAFDVGLDLVEISPNAEPPVCKIMNLGKFLYEEQKKKKEAKKKQKVVQTKEIKLRPTTDKHDLEYRIEHAKEFLAEGDKVKFAIKFKGRENAHIEFGYAKMNEIIEALKDHGKIEQNPKMESGSLTMIMGPNK